MNIVKILGATAILANVATYSIAADGTEKRQEQIHAVELDYLLWQKTEPTSSDYGPQALARAKQTAHDINTRFYEAIKAQEKRDIFPDFKKAVNTLNLYDLEMIERCVRYSKMRLKYGIGDGAEPFYSNACQFDRPDTPFKSNLYFGMGSYQHQIVRNKIAELKHKNS